MDRVTAIVLLSGGLDSLLACRIMASLAVRVVALKFVTPFFDVDLLGRADEYRAGMLEKYGIDVRLVDIGREYIELLKNPGHGYGKHFNPCIDCKILMLTRARQLMVEHGASFLVTGEVLGQRPMSQRRDTLRVIERESGCEDLLLRPLCAGLLDPTRPEREGLVDRQRLYSFSGRSRKQQIRLARELGINDYPAPAGGCVLTDPTLGPRIERFYADRAGAAPGAIQGNDIRLLLVGRQFRLPGDHWFILGRNEQENEKLVHLRGEGDWLLEAVDLPGPTALLRYAEQNLTGTPAEAAIASLAAGLVVRYGKKVKEQPQSVEVRIDTGRGQKMLSAQALDDGTFQAWQA